MYFSLDIKFWLTVSQVAAVLNLAFFSLISGYSRWTRNKLGEKCIHRSYLIIYSFIKCWPNRPMPMKNAHNLKISSGSVEEFVTEGENIEIKNPNCNRLEAEIPYPWANFGKQRQIVCFSFFLIFFSCYVCCIHSAFESTLTLLSYRIVSYLILTVEGRTSRNNAKLDRQTIRDWRWHWQRLTAWRRRVVVAVGTCTQSAETWSIHRAWRTSRLRPGRARRVVEDDRTTPHR